MRATRLSVANYNTTLSSDSLESGTGSSNSLRSTNESISLGLVCSIDRNSPRVALHSVVRRHQRRPTLCCVERKMPSNSLLASEAVPSVSFQRVIFPLTVIADPLFSE
jgi:hypothetical protein